MPCDERGVNFSGNIFRFPVKIDKQLIRNVFSVF